MKRPGWIWGALLLGLMGCSQVQTRAQVADEPEQEDVDVKSVKTIGDVTVYDKVSKVQVSGVGLVAGLEGTGGPAPAGQYRQLLEEQLNKQGCRNTKELLNSPNHAMVLVTARIPAGVRKGDPVDVEVMLPPQSKATSLRGGYLLDCPLKNWDSTKNVAPDSKGPDRLMPGHTLAKARGPLLVGFGEGTEDVRMRRGRIWEGGVSYVDLPVHLYLNNDQRFASVANAVANRINAAFPEDVDRQNRVQQAKRLLVLDEIAYQINDKQQTAAGSGRTTAKAVSKESIVLRVPYEYRLDPIRYLHVVRFIPLSLGGEQAAKYRKRLNEMLLEPKNTVVAALRLEALGKESMPAFKKALTNPNPLVRFAAAESLAYLGSTASIEELGRLAERYDTLRGLALAAMASVDESITISRLSRLTVADKPDLRYGAFRALMALDDANPEIKGDLLGDSFWLHHVAVTSNPMVHLSTNRRAEIVVFGESPKVNAPIRLQAGTEFTVTAEAGDDRCTISRFAVNSGRVARKQCGFDLQDILRTMAAMGAQYPDAVEFLRQLERTKAINCEVKADALPVAISLEVLAAAGTDLSQFKDNAEARQEVETIQQDLGLVNGQIAGGGTPTISSSGTVHRTSANAGGGQR